MAQTSNRNPPNTMPQYHPTLKSNARQLRNHLTDSEQRLWYHLRLKNLGVSFNRQKPLGNYIVDFYSHAAKLVIEIDGGQHVDAVNQLNDQRRDVYLMGLGLKVLRFTNLEVLQNLQGVLEVIFNAVQGRRH